MARRPTDAWRLYAVMASLDPAAASMDRPAGLEGLRIGVSGAYANAGLQRLSPTDTGEGYRYTAISINGAWTF